MNLSAGHAPRILVGVAFILVSALSLSGHADTAFTLATTLSRLEQSQSGRALVEKAMSTWNLTQKTELLGKLKWGSSSRTDAVLIRRYDVETGLESRERKVTVYLKEHQTLNNTVLDMAHELVHATTRPEWDPYDPTLTPARYIKTSIEGTGGEVEAVLTECQIGAELGVSDMTSRCQKYLGKTRTPFQVNERIRQDFYRVGKWLSEIKSTLGPELSQFPLLSAESPALYSSTGGAPYPASLLEEYRQMTAVACANTKRRMESPSPERAPASERRTTEGGGEAVFLARRCSRELASQ